MKNSQHTTESRSFVIAPTSRGLRQGAISDVAILRPARCPMPSQKSARSLRRRLLAMTGREFRRSLFVIAPTGRGLRQGALSDVAPRSSGKAHLAVGSVSDALSGIREIASSKTPRDDRGEFRRSLFVIARSD